VRSISKGLSIAKRDLARSANGKLLPLERKVCVNGEIQSRIVFCVNNEDRLKAVVHVECNNGFSFSRRSRALTQMTTGNLGFS
jgi:hypothetical protein